jgi:hypothetical protein
MAALNATEMGLKNVAQNQNAAYQNELSRMKNQYIKATAKNSELSLQVKQLNEKIK